MQTFAIVEGGMRNMATGEVVTGDTTPARNMLIGAHINPDNLTTWNSLTAAVGPMTVIRSYSSNLPASWTSTAANWHPATATTWHSVKANWQQMAAGSLDTALTTFVNSIPQKDVMLTFAHEPENDGGVASQWRAAQARFYDVVKNLRPDIQVGPVLMDWTFNPSSGRTVSDWTPATTKMDFFGIDTYNTYLFPMVGSPTKWDDTPSAALTTYLNLCDSLGKPPAVGECASAEHATDTTRKATWMHNLVDALDARGGTAVCWFHSYKPGDTAESMLLDSSPQAIAAWSAIVAAHA